MKIISLMLSKMVKDNRVRTEQEIKLRLNSIITNKRSMINISCLVFFFLYLINVIEWIREIINEIQGKTIIIIALMT